MNALFKWLALLVILSFLVVGCQPAPAPTEPPAEEPAAEAPTVAPTPEPLEQVKVQLVWVKQGEFHGYFNAVEEGFYADEGLDVEIVAGGPDVNVRQVTAAGEVDFGTGNPSTTIAARSNDVPLVMVAQTFQDTFVVYIAKKARGFETIEDVEGADFGVWFGGGEFQVQLMLDKAGVGKENVNLAPQKFSMIEFYEDKLDVASATLHNELHVVLDAGYSMDDLTIYQASDYGAMMIEDGLFTTEEMIRDKPEVVQAFVCASLRGWKWGLQHPEEAVAHVLKHNPELEYRKQLFQVEEVNKLISKRGAAENGLGYMDPEDWEVSEEGLLLIGAIDGPIDLEAARNDTFWANCPDEVTTLDDLDMDAINARIEENLSQ